jgi:hypothetical protein
MGFQSATNAIEYCGGMLLALAPRSHVTSSIRDCEFPNEAILEAVRVGSLPVLFGSCFLSAATQPT